LSRKTCQQLWFSRTHFSGYILSLAITPERDVKPTLQSDHDGAKLHLKIIMKTDNTTTGSDPSKKYEGTTSPKNPSLQLIVYTLIGVLVIVLGGLYYFSNINTPLQ
jgi:hypothetical protein